MSERIAAEAFALARQLETLLAGRGPDVQGAALVELVSLFLAGHPAAVRASVFAHWIQATRDLAEHNARLLWNDDGTPRRRA